MDGGSPSVNLRELSPNRQVDERREWGFSVDGIRPLH